MRSDNDTWDITTSVGSTDLFVAAALDYLRSVGRCTDSAEREAADMLAGMMSASAVKT